MESNGNSVAGLPIIEAMKKAIAMRRGDLADTDSDSKDDDDDDDDEWDD